MKRPFPFWLFSVSLFLAPTTPRWVTEGMFMDGMLYAVISRNLAEGVGTLWKPILTPTFTPDLFCDHPPFVFWIQSLFYRVLGNHILIENLYSFCTAVGTGVLMVALWRQLTRGSRQLRSLAWMPVLFWAMTPLVTWSYSYNMLENTLSIITTATCLVLIKGMMSGRARASFASVIGAAVLICAGLLSKGVLALFPVATIGAYWLMFRTIRVRAAIAWTALLIGLVGAMIALLLWSSEGARYNISRYLETQFFESMRGHRGSAPNRLDIVAKLLAELAPVIGVCAIVLVVNYFKRFASFARSDVFKGGVVCVLIGAAGSLPIVLSPRQSGFYLVPSFPLFAVGFALLMTPVVHAMVERVNVRAWGFKLFTAVSAVALVVIVVYSAGQYGSVRRNKNTIHDVKMIGSVVPGGSTVTICDATWRDWSFHGFASRYYRISLAKDEPVRAFAVIRDGRGCASLDINHYDRVPVDTRYYHLYQHVDHLENE